MKIVPVARALLSVSDKTGLVELANGLVERKVELVSTGGTFRTLQAAGLPVVEVANYTGFPEMLGGRVKTLHPKIHGGLLFRRDNEDDVAACKLNGIEPIDLVVVNLYPFEQTVAQADVEFHEAIEQIDIGGPSMIRSAAKNHASVTVITDPKQYSVLLAELASNDGGTRADFRRRLALAAFERTAEYDAAIADYLSEKVAPTESDRAFPQQLNLRFRKKFSLRYGENPHQPAAVYVDDHVGYACVGHGEPLHGKELSYNNLLDLDSALKLVREFASPAAAVIKHNNPCGCAVAPTLAEAFANAYAGDEVSAYGGILGFNRNVDLATAQAIAQPGRFVEAIVAPEFDPDAIEWLTTKPSWKANVRLVRVGSLEKGTRERSRAIAHRQIEGGMLRQVADLGVDTLAESQAVTKARPNAGQLADLQFVWNVVKHVGSNAIVLAKDGMLVGVGAGQMSRVDSVRIAIEKSAGRSDGSILASDAFFPFRDGVDLAIAAGVKAIVQPGGSKRDADAIAACDEAGIPMLFTGVRHFRH